MTQTDAAEHSAHIDYPDDAEKEQLRKTFYNATLLQRIDVTPDLARFRIRPDVPYSPFEPGQYVAIGLGNWEPRLRGTQAEDVPISKSRKVVRRAYSISCPMIDPVATVDLRDDVRHRLLPVDRIDYLEFYITLVRHGATTASKPPALTPRLFGKHEGDRLVMEKKITGKYVLGAIHPDHTVLMLGTGTGEAPHNAMATTLLHSGHRGPVVVATSVRYRADAGYLPEHEMLMDAFPNYRYLPLTTREPVNLDSSLPDYVGKQYLQEMFQSGKLAETAGTDLSPERTHVFLCGNPEMIGVVPVGSSMPDRPGMVPLLREAGFRDDDGTIDVDGFAPPGQIRFEKYW